MNVAIRVDGSRQIGSGHLIRCMTLAEQFRKHHHNVIFIIRAHLDSLHQLVQESGFSIELLSSSLSTFDIPDNLAHSKWLGVPQNFDANESLSVLKNKKIDLLIVDHYGIDHIWENILKPHVAKLMVIDDLADRQHNCDIILDQNYYTDLEHRYDDLVPASCKKLLGPKYALLKPSFFKLREGVKVRTDLKKILVFFGGADPNGQTLKTLQALEPFKNVSTGIVVIGRVNPNEAAIARLCKANRWVLHIQSNQMAELITECDLAIGAGGTSSWERCCLGLPTIVFALALNQLRVAKDLSTYGAAIYQSLESEQWPIELQGKVQTLIKNPSQLHEMSQKAFDLMAASDSVYDSICCVLELSAEITFVAATIDDAQLLFDWRNDELTRENSVNKAPVGWENHCQWLQSILTDSNVKLFIARRNLQSLGTVRLNVLDRGHELSWTIAPSFRGQGLGKLIVKRATSLCQGPVFARILSQNTASAKIAKAAGFHLISNDAQADWWGLEK